MALLLTSVFSVTGCGSDDDVQAESRVKNVAPEAQEAPEASGASDALSKADCDVFDFLDDPDLRYLRDVLDRRDQCAAASKSGNYAPEGDGVDEG